MITLLASAWAGSAGLTGGTIAFRGPVRHDLRPSLGAWGRAPVGPLELTGELLGGWKVRESIEHRVVLGRGSVVLGPASRGERASVGIGLGPGLNVRGGSAGDYGFVVLSPALRVMSHVDLRFGKSPLMMRYQMGASARGVLQWDFDLALGVGAWW